MIPGRVFCPGWIIWGKFDQPAPIQCSSKLPGMEATGHPVWSNANFLGIISHFCENSFQRTPEKEDFLSNQEAFSIALGIRMLYVKSISQSQLSV